jgi:hypothetical protein
VWEERRTQVQQVESLAQPLLMLQRVLCRPLGAVGSMLLLSSVDGATGSFDLRHPSQLSDAPHCSKVLL